VFIPGIFSMVIEVGYSYFAKFLGFCKFCGAGAVWRWGSRGGSWAWKMTPFRSARRRGMVRR